MTDTGSAPGTAKVEGVRPFRLISAFLLVLGCWAVFVGLGHLLARVELGSLSSSWIVQGVAVLLLAGVGALAWEFRRAVMRVVTSIAFSVALITAILLCTALGTVIVQQAEAQVYAQRHGEAIAAVLLFLGMDDIFHTGWFASLLGLVGVSLVLTAIEKRAWRPLWWGHLLSHLGFVVVLVGALIGSRWGFKGMIDLHEGQVATEARVEARGGGTVKRPLGFGVKLHRFALETYDPEAKLYVFEREAGGFHPVRSFTLDEAKSKRPLGGSGASFSLVAAYPHFELRPEVRPQPEGQGAQVLQIDFKQGDWSARAALQAGVAGRDGTPLSGAGPVVRFVRAAPDEAEQAKLATGNPERRVLLLDGEEELAVELGGTYAMGGGAWEVRVLEYLPDFSYDTAAKKAISRTQEPNNPALRIVVKDTKTGVETPRWLYARMPNFGHDGSETGPRLVFRHVPAANPPAREFLVAGASAEILRLERGRVVERLPLSRWAEAWAGLPVAGVQLHPSATVDMVPGTRSAALENPVADIIVEENGARREHRLSAQHGQPLALADGKTFLAFEVRRDEPKTFQSHLTIVAAGQDVAEKTIVVNDPLAYQGHMFYQSSFRKEDPTYSGIQVVYDPGLGVVFVGFAMMALGAVFVYYIRPRLMARESHGH
jgi:cytochrome c biogenesis protein ResB